MPRITAAFGLAAAAGAALRASSNMACAGITVESLQWPGNVSLELLDPNGIGVSECLNITTCDGVEPEDQSGMDSPVCCCGGCNQTGASNPSCVGGGCDQTGATGTHANCPGGYCNQRDVLTGGEGFGGVVTCDGGHCDQQGPKPGNPAWVKCGKAASENDGVKTGGFCCQNGITSGITYCGGGHCDQTGNPKEDCEGLDCTF